jgi:hypothetical protein
LAVIYEVSEEFKLPKCVFAALKEIFLVVGKVREAFEQAQPNKISDIKAA